MDDDELRCDDDFVFGGVLHFNQYLKNEDEVIHAKFGRGKVVAVKGSFAWVHFKNKQWSGLKTIHMAELIVSVFK